jgi:hypothetical protein
MPEDDFVSAMLEALLDQTRAIRDVKIQTESLKNMMFEHRPAFVPAFEEQVKKVTESPVLQQLDLLISRLEEALHTLRQP